MDANFPFKNLSGGGFYNFAGLTNTIKNMKRFLLFCLAIVALICFQNATAQHYHGDISYAYGIGIGDVDLNGWNIQTVHGYRFNDYLFVGGGIGLIKYSKVDDSIIPIFANVKGYLGNSHFANRFASIDLGYRAREKGGVYFNPAIGVQLRVFRRLGVIGSIGYQYAKMFNTSISNINIRIGICF